MRYLYKSNKLIQSILSEKIDSKYWLIESITGEYWYDGNTLIYCDGDICDVNHERIVIDHIMSMYDLSDYVESYGLEEITGILYSREDLQTEEGIAEYTETYRMNINIVKDILEKTSNMTDEELSYLGGKKDAREYGLKYLGWIRIKKNDFETYSMDNAQLTKILNAIHEIEDIEGYSDNEDGENEQTVNIEIVQTRQYYTNIPISVIENGDIGALQLYK